MICFPLSFWVQLLRSEDYFIPIVFKVFDTSDKIGMIQLVALMVLGGDRRPTAPPVILIILVLVLSLDNALDNLQNDNVLHPKVGRLQLQSWMPDISLFVW